MAALPILCLFGVSVTSSEINTMHPQDMHMNGRGSVGAVWECDMTESVGMSAVTKMEESFKGKPCDRVGLYSNLSTKAPLLLFLL